jgi:hypothetical protein
MLRRSPIDEVDAHLRMLVIVGAKQIGQEAGGEGRKDADTDLSPLNSPNGSHVPGTVSIC